LIALARARHPEIRFEAMDVRSLTQSSFGPVEGIWASFVPAYLPDLELTLSRWRECLRPGGWVALVEIDDLLGHEPLASALKEELTMFYREARSAGRYDFECGRRLAAAAAAAGLTILHEGTVADDELSFQGPAAADVLEAWRLRLQRMGGLRQFLGPRFTEVEHALLAALAAPDHRSIARVVVVVARRSSSSPCSSIRAARF
jgi:hypothetical protein